MMIARPYVTVSAAMALDGCIADTSSERLFISGKSDFEAVDRLRAEQDAVLVGAGTLRADNPRLVLRAEGPRRERVGAGRSGDPVKVTMTQKGDLSPDLEFFRSGDCLKLVYCGRGAAQALKQRLGEAATVVESSEILIYPEFLLSDLYARGVRKLLIEGGTQIISLFLQSGLADELRVAVGPFFVGEAGAPRLVRPGKYPWDKDKRLQLTAVEQLEDIAVLKYRVRRD